MPSKKVDDNSSYTMKSNEEIKMETPQESREADEKPNSMEDTLKEAMERMRRKHAMRTAGLLESTNESAPPEDESVRTRATIGTGGASGLEKAKGDGWRHALDATFSEGWYICKRGFEGSCAQVCGKETAVPLYGVGV